MVTLLYTAPLQDGSAGIVPRLIAEHGYAAVEKLGTFKTSKNVIKSVEKEHTPFYFVICAAFNGDSTHLLSSENHPGMYSSGRLSEETQAQSDQLSKRR